MALQCQVKDAFSTTQDKTEFNYCLCSRVVVHVKCSVSCIHNFVANFFPLFHVAKLSDFVLLNYLATTSLNLATVFSLKVSKWRHGIFFDFEPCRPNYTSKKIMHQWESYCLQ